MMYVEFMKTFLLTDTSELLALDSFWPPEPKNEFMKNFLIANSSELMAVRVISASWAQRCLSSTF